MVGSKPVCNSSMGTGTMSQTFDTNNRLVNHTEQDWTYKHTNPGQTTSWTFAWGPDDHVDVASSLESGGASDTATLHWDGDNLLFVNDKTSSGVSIYPDGALSGADNDFDYAGFTKSAEGYSLNLNTFQARGTDPETVSNYIEGFMYTAPGTITDGINTFQGVRQTDNLTNQWMTPDAYAGRVEDPMSQRPYMWNSNNPVSYTDPSGFCTTTQIAAAKAAHTECYDVIIHAKFGQVPTGEPKLGMVFEPGPGGMEAAAALGRAGEAAVRSVFDIGKKAIIRINGRRRIPDGLVEGESLSEVKNVEYQYFSTQLRDYSCYCQDMGIQFDLYVRGSTVASQSLLDAESQGLLNILRIPGT